MLNGDVTFRFVDEPVSEDGSHVAGVAEVLSPSGVPLPESRRVIVVAPPMPLPPLSGAWTVRGVDPRPGVLPSAVRTSVFASFDAEDKPPLVASKRVRAAFPTSAGDAERMRAYSLLGAHPDALSVYEAHAGAAEAHFFIDVGEAGCRIDPDAMDAEALELIGCKVGDRGALRLACAIAARKDAMVADGRGSSVPLECMLELAGDDADLLESALVFLDYYGVLELDCFTFSG